MQSQLLLSKALEFFFHFFILFLFLTLGSDEPAQLNVRYVYAFGLLGLLGIRGRPSLITLRRFGFVPLAILGLFLFYELLRALWGMVGMAAVLENHYSAFFQSYATAPIRWLFLAAVTCLSYHVVRNRTALEHFLRTLINSGFFLALVALPPLLQRGSTYYLAGASAQPVFFPPWMYFHPAVGDYLLGRFAHVNYLGDILLIGVFSASVLAFYFFGIFEDQKRDLRSRHISSLPWEISPYVLFPFVMALVMMACVMLLKSRGTIFSFTVFFLVFLLGVQLQLRSSWVRKFSVLLIVAIIGFGAWAGNLRDVVREIQTLSYEIKGPEDTGTAKSLDANREGALRAWEIFKDYPVWGVGSGSYKELSPVYATYEITDRSMDLPSFQSMCHYLQLLAEEGAASVFYFVFLASCLFLAGFHLFRIESRFRFLSAWAFFCIIGMILFHAAFNHLLERISMSALLHLILGALLGILREDYE